MLSVVVSLAAHACLAGVMRHAVLTNKLDISPRIALSRGRNAQVSATVSFIDPKPAPRSAENPTDTPDPEESFESLELDIWLPEVPLSSAVMHPDPTPRQSPSQANTGEPDQLQAPINRPGAPAQFQSLADRITARTPEPSTARSEPSGHVRPEPQLRVTETALLPTVPRPVGGSTKPDVRTEVSLSSLVMRPDSTPRQPPAEPNAGEPDHLPAPINRPEAAPQFQSFADRITASPPEPSVVRSDPSRPVRPEPQVRVIDAAIRPTVAPELPTEVAAVRQADPGVTEGTRLARPISPKYPPSCVRRGQQGMVILEVWVLATGRAGEIKIFKSSGYSQLDAAAVTAIRRARFVSARENGRNVDSRIKVPVRFLLR